MADLKTRPTHADVDRFLEAIADPQRREDCRTVAQIMSEVTGAQPRMWGEHIVGFGSYHYRYATGSEGDWCLTGFSPRKQNLTLYLTYGFEQHGEIMQRLGKYTVGKACLYLKRLDGVDLEALRELIRRSVEETRRLHAHADPATG